MKFDVNEILPGDRVSARLGDWIQTYGGNQFWPLDPHPTEVCILDIAHSLSHQCRYNGHCERFYSVAEHCVWVSYHVPEEHALWGLLHDASEAYLCDIPRPLKPYLASYKEIEATVMKAVAMRFHLPLVEPPEVKEIDNRIVTDEKLQNMKKPPVEWYVNFKPIGQKLEFWTPEVAKAKFLNRFYQLNAEYEERCDD